MLALPALQAVSALLAELSGPAPFPLAVFAVSFLAACKAICTHRQGHTLCRAEPAGLQPWAQRCPPQEQKHRGELVEGWGERLGGLHLLFRPRYQGTPREQGLPVPSSLIPPSSVPPRLRQHCCSFPKPCCSLPSPVFPVSSPARINTEHVFQCPGSLAAAFTQLPPPTPSHQGHRYPSPAPEPAPSPCSVERNRPRARRNQSPPFPV